MVARLSFVVPLGNLSSLLLLTYIPTLKGMGGGHYMAGSSEDPCMAPLTDPDMAQGTARGMAAYDPFGMAQGTVYEITTRVRTQMEPQPRV